LQEAITAGAFIGQPKTVQCGDVDAAFKQADHVLEGESHMGGQEHFYLETNTVLAIPKPEDDEIELFVSTQNPTETQHQVALTLNVPSNRVVVRVKRIGGGFGGKETRNVAFSSTCAVAARK